MLQHPEADGGSASYASLSTETPREALDVLHNEFFAQLEGDTGVPGVNLPTALWEVEHLATREFNPEYDELGVIAITTPEGDVYKKDY